MFTFSSFPNKIPSTGIKPNTESTLNNAYKILKTIFKYAYLRYGLAYTKIFLNEYAHKSSFERLYEIFV